MQGCTFCCFKAKPWRYFDNDGIAVHSRSDPKSAMTKVSYSRTCSFRSGHFWKSENSFFAITVEILIGWERKFQRTFTWSRQMP